MPENRNDADNEDIANADINDAGIVDDLDDDLVEEWQDGPTDSQVQMEGLTADDRAEVEADDLTVLNPNAEYDSDGDEIEPGAEDEYGSGVEGADQILEDERVHAEGDGPVESGDFEDRYGQDDTAAAEQGNRDEDQMVAEGEDAREVAELGGDDRDIDAIE